MQQQLTLPMHEMHGETEHLGGVRRRKKPALIGMMANTADQRGKEAHLGQRHAHENRNVAEALQGRCPPDELEQGYYLGRPGASSVCR